MTFGWKPALRSACPENFDSGPLSQPSSPPLSKNGQSDKGGDKGGDEVFQSPGFWDRRYAASGARHRSQAAKYPG
jgi:hypothetical protein